MSPTAFPILPTLRLEPIRPDIARPVATAALLADPVRGGILALLRDGPYCVCEMAAALEVRQNNLSNHLARLREAGLVRAGRRGGDTRRMYYERDDEACRGALDALGEVLG